MKLISLNIEVNKHYDTVLNFLKKENADIVCLQELLEDDFMRFKNELNLQGIFKAFSYVTSPHYEDIKAKKLGIGIFAPNITEGGYIFYFGKEENILRSFDEYVSDENNTKNSVLVWADIIDSQKNTFRFVTTHLPVTYHGESSPYQLENVDSLLKELSSFQEFVLCGDMNAPRGNETFTRLAKRYKDNIPLEYNTSIDQKLHRVKGLQYMVDGLFTTPLYFASNVKLVDGVSDHMAIVANIEKIDIMNIMYQFIAQNSDIILRLVTALFLGLVVGAERLLVHKDAGMKTHALVCLGAAVFVLVSEQTVQKYIGLPGLNPTMIPAQIIVGIGFLGAGSIMLYGSQLRGLTTAGGLWVMAGVGMAAGFGFFSLAIITTALMLMVLTFVNILEKPIRKISDGIDKTQA